MRRTLTILALAGALTAGGLALAQDKAMGPPAPKSYLGDAIPNTLAILPPAPTPGSFRYEADRGTFLTTRKLKDSPRWALAAADAVQTPKSLMKDLSCAAGVELSPETAPKLEKVYATMAPDLRRATDIAKDVIKRPRPFLIDDGDTCVAKPDTYDYPSGHTTWGWSMSLVLAELFPERATQILQRGRAYGESRIVCGVHNLSAIDAGRINGAALVAAMHGSPEFRSDLEAARKEAVRLRKTGKAPDPAACAAEAELVAQPIYR